MIKSEKSQFCPADITVVSVTYGDRWHLLRGVLRAAKEQGVRRVVVVDNASKVPVAPLAAAEFGDFVRVVRSEKNIGSAGGYKLALQTATALPSAELLFMLDDDNKPLPGCVAKLCETFNAKLAQWPLDNLIVTGFRSQCCGIKLRRASFLTFSVFDIPTKIIKRLPLPRLAAKSCGHCVPVDIAPYGGVLLHHSVLVRHGLPDERFMLYWDDNEFTYRITKGGGAIFLEKSAGIADIDSSWYTAADKSFALEVWLEGPDLRIFYTVRNSVYFMDYCTGHNRLLVFLNRNIYLALLALVAVFKGKLGRIRLIRRAIADGKAGRLGETPDFRLQ